MKKTKIEWCDSTWNPVTGCLHGCEYCYARKIANRFGTLYKYGIEPEDEGLTFDMLDAERFCELNEPERNGKGKIEPYPANFFPTFHRYRLDEPNRWTKPRTIFVCSMADLFGEWIPDEWIEEVFEACGKAPQHRYLFLTKNPNRYVSLAKAGKLPNRKNMWYGTTVTTPDESFFYSKEHNTFVSIEPIKSSFGCKSHDISDIIKWVIIGAETGNHKGKTVPKREWIEDIAEDCWMNHVPVFMKDSLIPIIGEENMKREFPWMED